MVELKINAGQGYCQICRSKIGECPQECLEYQEKMNEQLKLILEALQPIYEAVENSMKPIIDAFVELGKSIQKIED